MRCLCHRGIDDQRAGIDPLPRLDRPPIHMEKRVFRQAFLPGFRLDNITGPFHDLIAVAELLTGFPFAVAQMIDCRRTAFPSGTGNGEPRRIRRPNQ